MTAPDERAVTSTTSIVLRSLDNIQREIEDLRNLLGEKPVVRRSLRGLWRGVEISDDDIDEAKRSWMKNVDDFDNN
jgi:hypothetical protein